LKSSGVTSLKNSGVARSSMTACCTAGYKSKLDIKHGCHSMAVGNDLVGSPAPAAAAVTTTRAGKMSFMPVPDLASHSPVKPTSESSRDGPRARYFGPQETLSTLEIDHSGCPASRPGAVTTDVTPFEFWELEPSWRLLPLPQRRRD
jgi:hypothetical protein